jgi:2-hydroxychromene-2-carboxylate isomerase
VSAVRFYFDYVSPNAYLAWSALPGIAARRGVALEPVPVLFAGLLEAHGQLGPAEVPAKMRWMWRNNLRKAAHLGIALEPPAFHPFNPLLALRVSSLPLDAATRSALVDALFGAVWARGLHVSDPAVVTTIADGLGLDGAALVAAAGEEDAKARVRRQTDDAIARGVFGVPTMAVGPDLGAELFWGYDDLPHLERFLDADDPVDEARWAAWSAGLRPSAVRERKRPGG